MKQIEGINLPELVQDANAELLREQRSEGIQQIKKLFHGIFQLSTDITKAENELKKKRDQLRQKQGVLDRLRAGDWTALSEDKQQPKGESDGN